jgi:hypothetical protein
MIPGPARYTQAAVDVRRTSSDSASAPRQSPVNFFLGREV